MSIKKCRVIIGIIMLLFAMCLAGCALLYWLYSTQLYLPGQKVNGRDVSFMSLEEVELDLRSELSPLTIESNDKITEIYYVMDYNVNKQALYQTFDEWLRHEPIYAEVACTINYPVLEQYLRDHSQEAKDAYIEYSDGLWKLYPETIGFDIDVEAVLDTLRKSRVLHIDLDSYIRTPDIKADDLQEDFDKVEWLNEYMFSYASGYYLDGAALYPYVEDYVLNVPDEFIKEFISKATEVFNTSGDVTVLNPSNGEQIVQGRKTLKKTVNFKKEFEHLRKALDDHTSESNRIPETSGYDEVLDTYVLVSITDQHLWFIKDGEIEKETDVVTGTRGVHDTPTGAYYISECIPGKNLRGEDYVTWVNQWMRLTNSGVGLHDAYWRNKFGGEVYTYNGSHGCINLPKNFAKELYADVYVGIPVIIY